MVISINTQLVIVISINTKISNKASGWHALPVDLRNIHMHPCGGEGASRPGSMTYHGQTRKEARMSITFLSPRETTIIGLWNIRNMYEGGRTTQIAREFQRYKQTILGLSEVR